MKDSSTDKVITSRPIRRVRFVLGNSSVLVTKDVALMDDGSVRLISERTPAHSTQATVVTVSMGRSDFREVVRRVREFEADYITEELPPMVRHGKRWIPAESRDFGAFTVAVELGECERPWFFVVNAESTADAYATVSALPFYLEQLAAWEVQSFPYLEDESFPGIPKGTAYNDLRNEQYAGAGRPSVAA